MVLARGTPLSLFLGGLALMVAGFIPQVITITMPANLQTIAPFLSVIGLAFCLLLLWFFRDPERTIGDDIVSAADGTVTHVEQTENGTRINVFMSPLDVHVNRAPVAGKVISVTHHAGGHIPAFSKDSERNERLVVEWECEIGKVTTIQIAGSLARRIIPYINVGEQIAKGERYGLIRLGSRLDHFLPVGCELSVSKGDKVVAGVTTIAVVRGDN
jgi:phosphatidylserine decarboxylase